LLVGPVFTREAAIAPRRPRLYVLRVVYALSLFVLMCTAWLILLGAQIVQNVGDMARFGAILFQILAPLQLAMMLFLSSLQSASAVSLEKDRKTLILLLLTRMTNSELVLGKLFGSMISIGVLLLTAAPIFLFICLFGGVSFAQVGWVFAVTAATAFVAASLGSTLALWREKTFQALAMTAIILMAWIGFWEAIGLLGGNVVGISFRNIAATFSPLRAILAATNPVVGNQWMTSLLPYVIASLGLGVLLNLIAILRVRKWNPSRELRPPHHEEEQTASIWGVEHDLQLGEGSEEEASPEEIRQRLTAHRLAVQQRRNASAEAARGGHVDARLRTTSQESRKVWDNPVLWREMRTWAYGKKILIVRAIYILLLVAVAAASYLLLSNEATQELQGTRMPEIAKPLAPFFLVSLVILNALAVNSVTNERDGMSLDLLLVTDLSPKEFLFGKLLGVLYVTKEMVLLPMLLCVLLWAWGAYSLEILGYLLGALVVMNIFVASLGIHCGMTYANSRRAISVSLGTVFFLFLGIITCLILMISFSGSFQSQLPPFLAFIVGGGVGLYVALGYRNPSAALAFACGVLPLAMFFAITSLLLGRPLSVFLVITVIYAFATLAMLMPALGEYNIAMGRVRTAEDE
jgi:ABC-type transport system involved in multi-copper enzyme maturation permease subunit